jgi:transcriptional regulator with XRE-family HTH domain
MSTIDELFDVDPDDELQRKADILQRSDEELLRALIDHRISRRLTQAHVGDLMGISQATIAGFERDGGDPRLSTIRRYALAVDANIMHIVCNFNTRSSVKFEVAEDFGNVHPPVQTSFEDEDWQPPSAISRVARTHA